MKALLSQYLVQTGVALLGLTLMAYQIVKWLCKTIGKLATTIKNYCETRNASTKDFIELALDFVLPLMAVGLLSIILYFSWINLKDMKYVITKEYPSMYGVMESTGGTSEFSGLEVYFTDIKTGKRILLYIKQKPIVVGETYYIVYLPNSQLGVILARVE